MLKQWKGFEEERAKVGAEDWNRTSDTSIFSAVLYQLSYLGMLQAEPSS